MHSLLFSFNGADTTGRGSVFVFRSGKKSEVYLRAHVSNPTLAHAGLARVFLTRLERVDAKGKKTTLTHDTLPLNWALTSGADVNFYPGYEHFCDLAHFTLGGKSWAPMVTRAPSYWAQELSAPGIYRLHLLLTGPALKPQSAIFELRWPIKKISKDNFYFSLAK